MVQEQWLPWYPGQESGAWGRRWWPRRETEEVWSGPPDTPRTLYPGLTQTHTLIRVPTHLLYSRLTGEVLQACFSEQSRSDCAAAAAACRFRVSPSSATCSMGTFSSCAMKPMTEKMTNPANILVALFVHVTMTVSLQGNKRKKQMDRLNKLSVLEIMQCYLKTCHI